MNLMAWPTEVSTSDNGDDNDRCVIVIPIYELFVGGEGGYFKRAMALSSEIPLILVPIFVFFAI
jgi:hypothetical protein